MDPAVGALADRRIDGGLERHDRRIGEGRRPGVDGVIEGGVVRRCHFGQVQRCSTARVADVHEQLAVGQVPRGVGVLVGRGDDHHRHGDRQPEADRRQRRAGA